jgi:hypothetical protein
MVPRVLPVVMSLPVFRPDWKILAKLASTWSKLLYLDACPTATFIHRFCGSTNKPKLTWFWDLNQETVTVILRHKSPNQSCQFWGTNRKPFTTLVLRLNQETHHQFWCQIGRSCSTSFEAKLKKTVATGFEAKPAKTVSASFESKPLETVWVVLRSNHSQIVNRGFEAQPRNPHYLSPRVRCRSHTAPPDLSTARPSSTRPVRPSPVLCTRFPTPATILVAARHAAPATCTSWDKQTRFSKRNKDKRKTKQNYPGLKFKHRHVNDSSQSNQGTDHLVSQSLPWCVHW